MSQSRKPRVEAMRRRDFIKAIVGAIIARPFAAHSQQRAIPVIGFLHGGSADPKPNGPLVEPFREGLAQSGYIEGRNLVIEFRWAEGHYDRLAGLAADLVHREVAVIAAFSPPAVQAAKAAAATIPIVFESGNDPIEAGLVASFNRPGGNATGINIANDCPSLCARDLPTAGLRCGRGSAELWSGD